MSIAAALLLFAAGFAGPEAAGEQPHARDCSDDRGVNRCAADQQRRVRALFGVRSIEEHRDAGDQVRRAFYVDGYGQDTVAIELIRSKGADPMLRVHFPQQEGRARPEPLTAAIGSELWSAMLRRSEHFDREPAPERAQGKNGDGEAILLCLHSWFYTVEATDPGQGRWAAKPVRRRTEDACDNGLAEAFATELGAMAVPLLPPCAALDRKQHRNEMALLKVCGYLTGDRLAAAAVMNHIETLRDAEGEAGVAPITPLFAYEAALSWAGEASKKGEAAATWARKVREADASFYFDDITGETAERVRIRGGLYRRVGEEGAGREEAAPVELVWEEDGGDFQITQATVGVFAPVPKR
jgi:hypothetical protein